MIALSLLISQVGFEERANAELHQAELEGDRPTTVSLFVQTRNESLPTDRLIAALAAHLGEIGVHLEVAKTNSPQDSDTPPIAPAAPTTPAAEGTTSPLEPIALIWIREEAGQLRLQFYELSGGRLRARNIPLASTDAASIEEVSLVVRSYVDALLDGPEAQPVPQPKDPNPAPQVEPPKETPSSTENQEQQEGSPSFRLELGYAPSGIDLSETWQQGAAVSFVVRHWAPMSLGVSYTFLTHLVQDDDDVSLTLKRHPISLFAGIPIALTNRSTLEPRLALEADITSRSSTSTDQVSASESESRVIWSTSAQLQAGFSFSEHIGAFGTGGVSMVINRFDYVLDTNSEQQVLLSPDRVRPVMMLGLWGQWP